jgi:hypothetical protein
MVFRRELPDYGIVIFDRNRWRRVRAVDEPILLHFRDDTAADRPASP